MNDPSIPLKIEDTFLDTYDSVAGQVTLWTGFVRLTLNAQQRLPFRLAVSFSGTQYLELKTVFLLSRSQCYPVRLQPVYFPDSNLPVA